jgi:phosphoribosylglycinamide formyltransferase-1
MTRLRLGVLVSGWGTNLKALIDACRDPQFPAEVVVVRANKEAHALQHAARAGIPYAVFPRADYADRETRDLAMASELRARQVDLVVCAGYDAILKPAFTREFQGRTINIHPSLLPAFAGSMNAVARALEAGIVETGCTVHVLTDDVDSGPILGQRRVPIRSGDTVEMLHARIQEQEHRLLPDIIRQIALSSRTQP